jgi:predicted transposase/invertase (TIGR01784 family)
MLATQEPKLKHAAERVIRLSEDESMQLLYEAQEKAKRDRRAEIAYGEARGEKRGIVKVARNLLGLGLPLEQIVISTGLPIDKIEKLKNS